MARLKDFANYIEERHTVLLQVESKLLELQKKYETFYAEVSRVRESEFNQLRTHILDNPDKLSPEMTKGLAAAQAKAADDFDTELDQLKKQRDEIAQRAEKMRAAALTDENKAHKKNVVLDREEEKLKLRSRELLTQIAGFNKRIRALGHGFGFFTNLFRMRKLQRVRLRLISEQADVAARIDQLRQRWEDFDHEQAAKDAESKKNWVALRTEVAARQTKIEHLEASRQKIIQRSAIEAVLFASRPKLADPKPGDPPCPRCKMPNSPGNHFCRICAKRLVADRPDLAGSLEEIAELNLHYERFGDGMRACQEIIGLVRGLISGLEAFQNSVRDMIDSEHKYPLPKLQIDVPQKSLAYGRHFDELSAAVAADQSLHPKDFAERIRARMTEVYTEDKIKNYFETMGQELSRQAEAQW